MALDLWIIRPCDQDILVVYARFFLPAALRGVPVFRAAPLRYILYRYNCQCTKINILLIMYRKYVTFSLGNRMKSLNYEQLLSLLTVARQHSERDCVAILLAYSHGLRASEVVSLTRANVRDGYLTVQWLKGSRKTVQPLFSNPTNPLLDEKIAITAYLATVPAGARLFPISRVQFYRLFQRYAALAGIPSHLGHPHALKHSVAMALVGKIQINELQTYLGHSSLSSTGAYTRVSDQVACRAVAKAMAGA
jgi:integrase